MWVVPCGGRWKAGTGRGAEVWVDLYFSEEERGGEAVKVEVRLKSGWCQSGWWKAGKGHRSNGRFHSPT